MGDPANEGPCLRCEGVGYRAGEAARPTLALQAATPLSAAYLSLSLLHMCRCQAPANMQCPKCKSLKLPKARFCSQECFKVGVLVFVEHRSFHTPGGASKLAVVAVQVKETVPLR